MWFQADVSNCVLGASCCFAVSVAARCLPLQPAQSPVFCHNRDIPSPADIANISADTPPPPFESMSACAGLAHDYERFVPDAFALWNWRETGQVRMPFVN